MKILLHLILFFALLTSTFAQGILSETGGKFYVGVSGGLSFPTGDFGDYNPETQKSGYATTGYKLELNAGLRLFNVLEISALGFRNVNSTDPENLKIKLNAQFPSSNFKIESNDWIIYGGLGGFGISYPLPQKFIIDFKVLGGYLNITSPEFNFTTQNPGAYYKIESTTVSSPVYLTSFGIRYPVLPKLYTQLGFDYLGSTAKFNDVKTISSIEGEVTETTTSYERSLDAWTITLGLKFFIL